MRIVAIALLLAASCAQSNTGVDASPLVDAAPVVDADDRCPLAVNEIAASGDPEDWFELVNVSAGPIDLADYRFIDEADDPNAAVLFDGGVLAAGARIVQEVSDADQGFQLGADDALWLYRVGATEPCDGVDWSAGDAPSGGSYSRVPDGTGGFTTTQPATRGAHN